MHSNGITLSRDTNINGKLELADYSKFDERYISNIRRGANVQSPDTSEWGPNECPSGCVLTQVVHKGNTEYGVNNWYCPFQIFINGQWKTLAGDL
ncbi:hypothetical protein BBD39_11220 [Arsenophonus endosymbiont of Bemisia tabaci Asia II 3]|nr:hypothetical protein BBD39_11220 [Arsenophonus endosymbiont of Bemisia tabaci Asia II 3]